MRGESAAHALEIALKTAALVKALIAGFVVAALLALVVADSHSAAVPEIEYPELPSIAQPGATLKLTVSIPVGVEARWFTKYSGDAWVLARDWAKSGDFQIRFDRPGNYAVQVDLRTDGKIIAQKWLGQIEVPARLVEGILAEPTALALPMDQPVRFLLMPGNVSVDELEFKLMALEAAQEQQWTVVQDFHGWPLADFYAGKPTKYALEVLVRQKTERQIIQKLWLGNYFFSGQFPERNNLMRVLLYDNFNTKNISKNIKTLSNELLFAVNLLEWEYNRVPASRQRDMIRGLGFVREISYEAPAVRFRMDGREYVFNLETRYLHRAGSSHMAIVSLSNFQDYREVFDKASALSNDALIPAALTYAVYAGYNYGTPAAYSMQDLNSGAADCAGLAHLLFSVLKNSGYRDVYFVGLDQFAKDFSIASSHLLLQLHTAGGSYVLDPSAGYIYKYNMRDYGKKEIPAPTALPQKANLAELDIRNILKEKTNIWLASGLNETTEAGILSPPLPTEFVSGDCAKWLSRIKIKHVYNAASKLCH